MPKVDFPPCVFFDSPFFVLDVVICNNMVIWKMIRVKIVLAGVVKIPSLIIVVLDFAVRQTSVW